MPGDIGTIVIPCFNEQFRFNYNYFNELNGKLINSGIELVFINDGSTDRTLHILQNMQFKPRIINLPKNVGKAEAIRTALMHEINIESKKIFGYLDSDASFNLEDVALLAKDFISNSRLAGFQILSAARVKLAGASIERRTYRHFVGRLVSSFINLGLKNKMYDPQSGFKLYRKNDELLKAIKNPFITRWFIDMEIIRHYNVYNNPIIEIPVQSWIDTPGSKIIAREYLRIFRELFKIKLLIRMN